LCHRIANELTIHRVAAADILWRLYLSRRRIRQSTLPAQVPQATEAMGGWYLRSMAGPDPSATASLRSGRQNHQRRWHVAPGLCCRQGGRGGHGAAHVRRQRSAAARHAVALVVPGLGRLRAGEQPLPCDFNDRAGLGEGVHDAPASTTPLRDRVGGNRRLTVASPAASRRPIHR
jgi:hypothetical protein